MAVLGFALRAEQLREHKEEEKAVAEEWKQPLEQDAEMEEMWGRALRAVVFIMDCPLPFRILCFWKPCRAAPHRVHDPENSAPG